MLVPDTDVAPTIIGEFKTGVSVVSTVTVTELDATEMDLPDAVALAVIA